MIGKKHNPLLRLDTLVRDIVREIHYGMLLLCVQPIVPVYASPTLVIAQPAEHTGRLLVSGARNEIKRLFSPVMVKLEA